MCPRSQISVVTAAPLQQNGQNTPRKGWSGRAMRNLLGDGTEG